MRQIMDKHPPNFFENLIGKNFLKLIFKINILNKSLDSKHSWGNHTSTVYFHELKLKFGRYCEKKRDYSNFFLFDLHKHIFNLFRMLTRYHLQDDIYIFYIHDFKFHRVSSNTKDDFMRGSRKISPRDMCVPRHIFGNITM